MMHPELRIYIYAYYIRDLYMADFNFSKVKDIETYIKASNEGYLSWIQENSSISFEEYFYRYFVDEAKGGNYVFENHIRDARKYIKLVTTGVKRIQTYGEYDGKLIKPISADTTINTDDIREAIKKWSWTQHWSR